MAYAEAVGAGAAGMANGVLLLFRLPGPLDVEGRRRWPLSTCEDGAGAQLVPPLVCAESALPLLSPSSFCVKKGGIYEHIHVQSKRPATVYACSLLMDV